MLAFLLAAQIDVTQVSFPSKAPDNVTLPGTLYQPQGLTTRVPAVVVLHTCAGPGPNDGAWADWFAQNGYVALTVDSFGPRHVNNVCGSQEVPPHQRAFDAYGALAYLRTVPNVDGAHVGVIGFSHGGGTALFTENADVTATAGFSGNGFAAAVALYPSSCDARPTSVLADPLLLLIGASDDWTDAKSCEDFIGALSSSGAPGTIHVYPRTYHKFDDPAASKEAHIHGHVYTLQYNAAAASDAHDRILAFFKEYL